MGDHSSNRVVSLACAIRKSPEFVEMHTNLAPGSPTLFRHKWRTLYTLLFLFIVLVSKVASLNGKMVIHLWVRFEFEVLSYCIFRKSLQLDSKTDLTTNGLNWSLFVVVGLVSMSSYLYRLKSTWIALLCFFLTIWHLFDKKPEWISDLFFECAMILAIGFSNINWWEFWCKITLLRLLVRLWGFFFCK